MSVCVLKNLEKYRVLWTDFLASCREINQFSVSTRIPRNAVSRLPALFHKIEVNL